MYINNRRLQFKTFVVYGANVWIIIEILSALLTNINNLKIVVISLFILSPILGFFIFLIYLRYSILNPKFIIDKYEITIKRIVKVEKIDLRKIIKITKSKKAHIGLLYNIEFDSILFYDKKGFVNYITIRKDVISDYSLFKKELINVSEINNINLDFD